jgi:ElaB/YqjD/DUF883 family membrane-anchored ribosome-binding protein
MSEQNTPNSSGIEKELNKLGENLNNLFKALWESDERKSIEREVTAGLEQANKSVKDTVEKIRTDQTTNDLKKGVKDAWETARGPQILSELQAGLTATLHKLNDEIAKRAQPAQEVKPDAHKAAEDVVDAVVTPMGDKKPE